jgi:hypothetical protein
MKAIKLFHKNGKHVIVDVGSVGEATWRKAGYTIEKAEESKTPPPPKKDPDKKPEKDAPPTETPPNKGEILAYLKERDVKVSARLGIDKLRVIYAEEKAKEE